MIELAESVNHDRITEEDIAFLDEIHGMRSWQLKDLPEKTREKFNAKDRKFENVLTSFYKKLMLIEGRAYRIKFTKDIADQFEKALQEGYYIDSDDYGRPYFESSRTGEIVKGSVGEWYLSKETVGIFHRKLNPVKAVGVTGCTDIRVGKIGKFWYPTGIGASFLGEMVIGMGEWETHYGGVPAAGSYADEIYRADNSKRATISALELLRDIFSDSGWRIER